MGDKYYAHQKFAAAVRILAVNGGPRREVLNEARLEFGPITETDLPPESLALEDFRSLRARLKGAIGSSGTGAAPARLALSEDEARAIALLIVNIYSELTQAIIKAQQNGERWGAHH
jgi:hypothetical protein